MAHRLNMVNAWRQVARDKHQIIKGKLKRIGYLEESYKTIFNLYMEEKADADRRLGMLRRALLLLRDEVDPTADFDGWLAHMRRIGYPEFESELAEELK